MTDTAIAPARSETAEDAVPRFVSEAEYLRVWAEQGYEWADGEMNRVPANADHFEMQVYLLVLLKEYFALRPIGRLIGAPFMLQLDVTNTRRYREPDLMVLLHENSVGTSTDTRVIGAADICIEIVSPESIVRDYHTKLLEYQDAGVREYWIIDPERQTALFNVRNAEARFSHAVLTGSVYSTPLLPGLTIDTAAFWQSPLPRPGAIADMVRAMLKDTTP